MKLLIIMLVTFSTVSQAFSQEAYYSYEEIPFQQKTKKLDSELSYSDLELIKVEMQYRHSMSGFGMQKSAQKKIVTLKVLDEHFNKGFEVNGSLVAFTYLWDEGDYDIIQLELDVYSLMDQIVFISNFSRTTPTIGNSKLYSGQQVHLEVVYR